MYSFPAGQYQRQRYNWYFEVPNVNKAVIGTDFFSAFNLKVEIAKGMVTSNKDSNICLTGSLHNLSIAFDINNIIATYPDVCGLQELENPPPLHVNVDNILKRSSSPPKKLSQREKATGLALTPLGQPLAHGEEETWQLEVQPGLLQNPQHHCPVINLKSSYN